MILLSISAASPVTCLVANVPQTRSGVSDPSLMRALSCASLMPRYRAVAALLMMGDSGSRSGLAAARGILGGGLREDDGELNAADSFADQIAVLRVDFDSDGLSTVRDRGGQGSASARERVEHDSTWWARG